MKPSNTGRLIADILPDTAAFQWSRTEPPQALPSLVASDDYQPMVVFPASYAGDSRQVLASPPTGKPPLFIMLDGTWTEARKMFPQKPLSGCIAGNLCRSCACLLIGCAKLMQKASTAPLKWRFALLDLAGDTQAASALGDHFSCFRERYLAGKPDRTVRKHHSSGAGKRLKSSGHSLFRRLV